MIVLQANDARAGRGHRRLDEFNLTLLEKLPRAELVKQVNAYVANYVRTEKLSLNQKELEIFSEEILDEMTGYGPIEPLLKDPTVTGIAPESKLAR